MEVCLYLKCPFPGPHDRLKAAILADAVDVHFTRADHEVDMDETLVASAGCEFLVGHFSSALDRGAVGIPQGDMTGRVFVKERIVKKNATLADGGAVRHQRYLPQATGIFIGLEKPAQIVLSLF